MFALVERVTLPNDIYTSQQLIGKTPEAKLTSLFGSRVQALSDPKC